MSAPGTHHIRAIDVAHQLLRVLAVDHRQTADIVLQHLRHGVKYALVGIGNHQRARARRRARSFRLTDPPAARAANRLASQSLQTSAGIHNGQAHDAARFSNRRSQIDRRLAERFPPGATVATSRTMTSSTLSCLSAFDLVFLARDQSHPRQLFRHDRVRHIAHAQWHRRRRKPG